MKIITREEFNKLKNECKTYEETKLLMIKCINEVYHINMNMFEELLDQLKQYRENKL